MNGGVARHIGQYSLRQRQLETVNDGRLLAMFTDQMGHIGERRAPPMEAIHDRPMERR